MKRRLAALATAMLMLLTGTACGKKQPQTARAADFSCNFSATCNGMPLSGSLTRYTAGTLELKFNEPATVRGLTATWNGEKVALSMLGLNFELDPADIPESALGESVVAVLDEVLYNGESGVQQEGTLVFEGRVAGGAYTLVCDGESGLPQSLSIPDANLQVRFTQSE